MKLLYLGTDPTHFKTDKELIHYPIIRIVPRPLRMLKKACAQYVHYTHLLFTSKHAVEIFFTHTSSLPSSSHYFLAVGKSTARVLERYGYVAYTPLEETQEGLMALLKTLNAEQTSVFFPRSSLSRDLLIQFLEKENIPYFAPIFYDTLTQKQEPLPNLSDFDEIVFTSPSTVQAFIEIFGAFPTHAVLTPIGPITAASLKSVS